MISFVLLFSISVSLEQHVDRHPLTETRFSIGGLLILVLRFSPELRDDSVLFEPGFEAKSNTTK